MKAAPSVREESHGERFNIEIDGSPFAPSDRSQTLADVLNEIQDKYSSEYIITSAEWNGSDVPEDVWDLNRDVLIGCFSLSMRSRIEFFPEKLKTSLAHLDHLEGELDRILHLKNEEESGVISSSDWQVVDDFQAFAEWITTIFDLDSSLKSYAGEALAVCWKRLLSTTAMFSAISQKESGFVFKRETRRELLPLLEQYRSICKEALSMCC